MLVVAIAGGFGSVFGVPLAGEVFALEVRSGGRLRRQAILPGLVAASVGDLVVRGLGVEHTPTPDLGWVEPSPALVGKVLVAGFGFGLAALVFERATHGVKRLFARGIAWPPARPVLGGLLVIGLTLAVGTRDYNGLSLGLAADALDGDGVPTWAFLAKTLFTAVTLGSGFVGGEVTPLFVVGATLGATLAVVLGVPVPFLAALGFVAVFAGAANTPIACTVMGAELFGVGAVPYLALACATAYLCSSHRGIYGSRRQTSPEGAGPDGD